MFEGAESEIAEMEGKHDNDQQYKDDEGSGTNDNALKSLIMIKSQSSFKSSFSHLLDIFENLDLLFHESDLNENDNIGSNLNFIDLLYCLGIVGLGIRVRRIAASNIDPWQIGIDYVHTLLMAMITYSVS